MKRVGYLVEQIVDFDNLCLAFYKASKGKLRKQEVIEYQKELNHNLNRLKNQIETRTISVGKYKYFKIFDPKERLICAASFDERVLHHAIMNICHPIFEKHLIFDTYATRINKGIYKALDKVKQFAPKYEYVAKLDFKKYFYSISHQTLKEKLTKLFKDKHLLYLLNEIIDSYDLGDGKGLPIGNLTSQYLANFYLSDLDHFIKEKLKVKVYVRYMDDMLIMSNSKDEIKFWISEIKKFSDLLSLRLKPTVLSKTFMGFSFLGYKIYPHKVLLNKNSKHRFKRKYKLYTKLLENEIWTEKEYQQHIEPLISFAKYANTLGLRKEILAGSNRVLRGGSWNNNASNCRVANRNNNTPSNRNNNNGMRVALAQE